MNARSESFRGRRQTLPDMLPTGFRDRGGKLARSRPPGWMTWAWVGAAAATLAVLAATLAGPMDEIVLAGGEVRPAEYALVFPQAGGTVAEVLVHPGQRVRAGEILARLDAFDLERQRADLDADLAQARADQAMAAAQAAAARQAPLPPDLLYQARIRARLETVVTMRRDLLARLEALSGSSSVSLLELVRERLAVQVAELDLERSRQAEALQAGDYARAQVAAAEGRQRAADARVAGLEARRVLLDRELERRVVHAPADGLVVSRAVRFAGEKVELGAALFKLAYGSATRLRLSASEDRVDRIKPGMLVRFRPRSDPDRLRPLAVGRVEEVALDRELGAAADGTYAIDVAVERAGELPLGAAVDAEIVLGQRPFWRVLLLRAEAPAR